METAHSPEMLVTTCQTSRRHNPEHTIQIFTAMKISKLHTNLTDHHNFVFSYPVLNFGHTQCESMPDVQLP